MQVQTLLAEIAVGATITVPSFVTQRMTRRERRFDYTPRFTDLRISARFESLKARKPALINAQGVQRYVNV